MGAHIQTGRPADSNHGQARTGPNAELRVHVECRKASFCESCGLNLHERLPTVKSKYGRLAVVAHHNQLSLRSVATRIYDATGMKAEELQEHFGSEPPELESPGGRAQGPAESPWAHGQGNCPELRERQPFSSSKRRRRWLTISRM
jgi:hypothetical protein